MAKTFVTPLMLLTLPTPGQEPGPDWANDINVAMETIDSHDHTSGKGTPVPATGIYIGSDLNWNSNNILGLRSNRFISQVGALSTADDKNCIYFSNGNFFVNDSSGNQIQLTASGGLNAASIGGIGGDYAGSGASVSYSSTTKTFSFTQATATVAKMFFGDIAIAEAVSGAQAITIKSPTGLSTAYTTILPTAIPTTGQQFLTSDATGQQSYVPYNATNFELAAGVFQLKDLGISTAKINDYQVTNQKLSASNQVFSVVIDAVNVIGTAAYANITGMNGTITTVGRPVEISFAPGLFNAGLTNTSAFNLIVHSTDLVANINIGLLCDGALVQQTTIAYAVPNTTLVIPPSQIKFIHRPSVGTHTYQIQMQGNSTSTLSGLNIENTQLVLREL